MVSLAGLAVLGATMSVSFLGSTGTSTTTVNAASSAFVYPITSGAALPCAVTSLEYTPAIAITAGTGSNCATTPTKVTTATTPSWSPTALAAGSVTTAGDIGLIDATIAANGVIVSLYITNLALLQTDYSSFAFPVNIYSAACSAGCTWGQASNVIASPPTFLTSTGGFLTFNLPAGKYYDITFDTGGSFYCTATTSSATASLSPSFYMTAQPY